MARAIVEPSRLSGSVEAPPSKSYTHRVLLAALLAEGVSIAENLLDSSDTRATRAAVEALGASTRGSWERLVIEPPGGGPRWAPCIDAGESGTTARLVAAPLALLDAPVVVYGRGRLHERPVEPLLEALRGLGVYAASRRGCCPPYTVRGPAEGERTRVDAGMSSQFLSALLLLGAGLGGLEVEVLRLESRPYAGITARVLGWFGVHVEALEGGRLYRVRGRPRGARVRVPGDWSSAAHLLAAAALAGGEVLVEGVDPEDPQPDRAIVEVLSSAGIDCAAAPWRVRCASPGAGGYRGFEACVRDSPDLAPALAAAAVGACGSSRICCADRLRLKESDRVAAILDMVSRAGAPARLVEEPGRGLCIVIEGRCGPPRRGAVYSSHGDHRIAMAAAALALAGGGVVEDPGVVAKSYPGFWEALSRLGARIRLEP